MVALSLIPGAAHIDLGRTIQGLLYFLLFALCLNGALIAPFLSSDPDLRLRCALGAGVFCFALAIPLLVCSLLVAKAAASRPRTRLRILADTFGVLCAVVGFACLFLHINDAAGVAFIATCVLALGLFVASARSAA